MTVLQALLLAVACLPLAASKQSTCDLDGGEEFALLQRGLHAESIDRSSDRKADPPAENNDEALEKLNNLEALQKKALDGASIDGDSQNVVAFGQSIGQAAACLQSKSCSKPELAEHVLTMISTGLVMAGQPELAVISGLAEVLVGLFFPQKKKAGKPPLTLKAIGDVVTKSLENFAQQQVDHIGMPDIRASIQTVINNMGIALSSNDTNTFTDFRNSLYTVTLGIQQSVVQKARRGWRTTLLDMQKTQDLIPFQTSPSPMNEQITECEEKCGNRQNADNHWNKWNSNCSINMDKVGKQWKTFENVAHQFIGISNALALMVSMANGVYKRFDETPGPLLADLLSDVLPIIKASLKVSEGLLSFEAHCADTFFNQWANSTGTNMPVTMNTRRHHRECADTDAYGHGWKLITPVALTVGRESTYHNYTKFGFSTSEGGNNWKGVWWTRPGVQPPSYVTKLNYNYFYQKWWYMMCYETLDKLTGIPKGTLAYQENTDPGMFGGATRKFVKGSAVGPGAAKLCESIWYEADYDSHELMMSNYFDQTYFQVCARKQVCAADECTSIFKSFAQSFGLEEIDE